MSNLKNIFDLFLGKDDLRPEVHTPFVHKGKTYATNLHVLVRCDSNLIDFDFEEHSGAPNVTRLPFQKNIISVIPVDNIDWSKWMTEDEYEGGQDVDCGCCGGDGKFYDFLSYKGKRYDYEYDCPVCDGYGIIEEVGTPTGNKCIPHGYYVKVIDAYIDANYFYLLKKVRELIGEDIILVRHDGSHNPLVFQIGFLEVLIMPVAHTPNDNIIVSY